MSSFKNTGYYLSKYEKICSDQEGFIHKEFSNYSYSYRS